MGSQWNVILITIDCLRADYVCNSYGAREETPNIHRLARGGVLFSHAIANGPGTPESFPSIMTSTYPLMSPNSGGGPNFWVELSSKWLTLAQVVQSQGFFTAAFNANPFLTSFSQYDRGFDVFDDSLEFYERANFYDKLRRKLGTLRGDKFLRARLVNKKAIQCLKESTRNFFLWLHYMDVHSPYNPKNTSIFGRIDAIRLERKISINPGKVTPEELRRLIGFYKQEIRYVDGEIGQLLSDLAKLGISPENTFFVVTADHGEQFMEHGEWGHGRLYDEIIRVPLIISGPETKQGSIIQDQVQLLDVAPTILNLVNIPRVESFLGTTLVPIMRGNAEGSPKSDVHVISETLNRNFSCRTKHWKYITDRKSRHELYNLQVDPWEKTNLASKNTEKIKELDAIVEEHMQMEDDARKTIPERAPILYEKEKEKLKNRLKELGYL